jgi:hypothetical protein
MLDAPGTKRSQSVHFMMPTTCLSSLGMLWPRLLEPAVPANLPWSQPGDQPEFAVPAVIIVVNSIIALSIIMHTPSQRNLCHQHHHWFS